MSIAAFDTLKFSRRLQEAGMESSQAEALAEAQRDALNETLDGQVATRDDIHEIKFEIQELRGKINLLQWMLGFNLLLSFAMLSMLAALLLGK